MANDQEIKQMHQAKIQRWDNSSLGAQIGGLLHDAVALTIADYGYALKSSGRPSLEKQVKIWLDILYKISEEKKFEIINPQKAKIEELKDWVKKMDSGEIQKEKQQILETEARIERSKIDEVVDEVHQSEELGK